VIRSSETGIVEQRQAVAERRREEVNVLLTTPIETARCQNEPIDIDPTEANDPAFPGQ